MDKEGLLPGPELWIFTIRDPADELIDQLTEYMARDGMNWIIVNIRNPVGKFSNPGDFAGGIAVR